jgi:hypothetical protein
VAGGGTLFGEGGPATSAQLPDPAGFGVDSAGNLYIADEYTGLIRKVSKGVITTVASSGQSAWGFGVDSAGNLYIAANNCLYKVSGDRVVTTLAGNGTPGFSGDGGPAIDAQLDGPAGVGVDPAGNIYIADLNNHRVRILRPEPNSSGGVTNSAGNHSTPITLPLTVPAATFQVPSNK